MHIALLQLLIVSAALSSYRVCVNQHIVPHVGTAGRTNLTMYVWNLCIATPASQPSVFIVNGGLIKSNSYSYLATQLAQRGFTVVASDYASRRYETVVNFTKSRIEAGFDCPPNGVIGAVSALHRTMRFASANRLANTSRVLLFGHSYGGLVSLWSLYKLCNKNSSAENYDIYCDDGAVNDITPPYKVQLFALFDGGFPDPTLQYSSRFMHLSIYSQYLALGSYNASQSLTLRRDNALDVVMNLDVNHFGPNDFAPAFNHVHTSCSGALISDAGARFRTTKIKQEGVIRSIADMLALSYYSYASSSDKAVGFIADAIRKVQFVDSVTAPRRL